MSVSLEQLGIDRLTLAERLELIGLIWDSLDDSETGGAIPDWHVEELRRRRATAEADPSAGTSWETVKARLTHRS